MKEIVGNLVMTNLQNYLEKPWIGFSSENEFLSETMNELSKRIPSNHHRVRRSIIDAYEAVLADNDPNIRKKKLNKLDFPSIEEISTNDSQTSIIHHDS